MTFEEAKANCDFSGWATRNDLKCTDGRIIRHNAFQVNDGKKVPLVWMHQHDTPSAILGHAYLENKSEGVYAYGIFNGTPSGLDAKEAVIHGDVNSMSIWANNLTQSGSDVLHGTIREVSLVMAGANPGAFIESVMAHGDPLDEEETEGILYTNESILVHAGNISSSNGGSMGTSNSKEKTTDQPKKKSIKDIFEGMTDEQQDAVAVIVGKAVEEAENKAKSRKKEISHDGMEENNDMKWNAFQGTPDPETNGYLSHSDEQKILDDAKKLGSLREAIRTNMEDGGVLAHADIDTTGMDTAVGTQTYGFNDPSMLFPDFKSLNNTPEWLSRDMDWVKVVMGGVHHTPFSRIKSMYANITEDEARAKGYIKGKQKKTEVFTTLKRTTTPQTIYKLQKMDRDDIVDITGFDVVAWIRAEMRVMLDEEIARAILIGDGRSADAEDKIKEENVRPIVSDVPLFNIMRKVTPAAGASDADAAKLTIAEAIRARKSYKGTGNPTFFTTEDVLTEMLLLEDTIGHRLYKTEAELATALRVTKIQTVEPMEGLKVKMNNAPTDTKSYPLIGIITNLADYNVGADKGGEITNFEDFDIDYNQYKYLIETRISGALTKPFSAITLVRGDQGVTPPASGDTENP